MGRSEPRIILPAAAVFTALAGMGATIRGLLFDSQAFIHYGALALILGVASFVVLLCPRLETTLCSSRVGASPRQCPRFCRPE